MKETRDQGPFDLLARFLTCLLIWGREAEGQQQEKNQPHGCRHRAETVFQGPRPGLLIPIHPSKVIWYLYPWGGAS